MSKGNFAYWANTFEGIPKRQKCIRENTLKSDDICQFFDNDKFIESNNSRDKTIMVKDS